MESSMFSARVISRTLGPSCSNIVTFCVEGHPGVTFCAYAVSDGAIIIQQSLQPASPRNAPVASGGHSKALPGALRPPPHDPRVGLGAAGGGGSFAPVLLIDGVALEHGSDCFSRICWGGGPQALLAAATRQHVYFFSLLPYFQGAGSQLATHLTATLPPPSTAFTFCGMYRTAMPATAMDFTQNARGLLVTDAGNNVTMLTLVPKETLAPYGMPTSASSAVATSLAEPPPTTARASPAAAAVALAVHEAWRVRADATHTLAAASLDCHSPCATTTAASGGGGGPHKVTIWWPTAPPSETYAAAAAAAGAGGSGGHSTHPDGSAVGAEIVRHPVRVLSLQWSPPLAASRPSTSGAAGFGDAPSAAAASGSGHGGGSGSGHGKPPPRSTSGIESSSTGQQTQQLAAPAPTPSTAPALMTLGADWVIRIFVEVVMQNMLPPELAASAAGSSMSQFCLTLVIEPPGLNLAPSSRPGMRVSWARPLGTGHDSAAGPAASGGAGAGVGAVAAAATAEGGLQPDGGGMGGNEDGSGALGGGGGGGGGGSRLQWIVASVGMMANEDLSGHDLGVSGGASAPIEEAVCVWAVDGLSAVVLSGMPRGAVASSKTAASPKAVLWGIEHRSVSWLQPGKLLPAGPGGLRPGDYAISAYVTYPGGMPLIRAGDSCIGMQGAYAEVRGYQITPTATTTPGSTGQTATFLRGGSLARQALTGSPETISSMLLHPVADVALLRDRTGGVALWSLSPLCELPIGVTPAAASASRVLLASAGQLAAVTWLSCSSRVPPPPPAAQYDNTTGVDADGGGAGGVLAYMACIHGRRLLVYAVLLPAATVSGWTAAAVNAAIAAVQSGALGWGAMFLSEVLRVELPPAVTAVRSLHEVSYERLTSDDTSVASEDGQVFATATLVALASRTVAGASQAPGSASPRSAAAAKRPSPPPPRPQSRSAGGALSYDDPPPPGPRPDEQEQQQEVWLTWRLGVRRLSHPAGSPGGGLAVDLVSGDVDEVAVAIATAVGPSLGPADDGFGAVPSGAGPRTAIVSCCCTSLASPFDSDLSSISISSSKRSSRDGSAAGISGDAGLGRVPCLMSGSSDGYVHFWRPAANSGGCGLQLVQRLPCRSHWRRRTTSGDVDVGLGVGAGILGVAESPRSAGGGGGSVAGMVVAVALDEVSGYAASATTCGDGEEEALYIWRLREDFDDGSSGSGSGSETSSHAAGGYGQYELESVVPVIDTVSSLAWLAAAGYSACLAVGYASGRMGLLVRDRRGGWQEVVSYNGAASVAAFGSARGGAIAMAAGNHLVCFSNALDCTDPNQRPDYTIATVAAEFAGPLPPYHPGTIHGLVAKGKISSACRVLRSLLEWLRDGSCRSVADGYEAGPSEGKEGTEGEGSRPAGRSLRPGAAARQPLVVDLAELLTDGLTSSRGFGAFMQVLTAPVPAAPPVSALAGATGGMDAVPRPGGGAPVVAAAGAAAPFAGLRAGAGAVGANPDGPLKPLGLLSARPPLMPALSGETRGRAVPQPAPPPPSGLHSGVVDLSAFGGMGFGGGGFDGAGGGSARASTVRAQAPTWVPQPAVATTAAPHDTMSAFGDWGSMSGRAAAAPPPQPRPSPPQSALETGTLDMSAFGGFGHFAEEPPDAPPLPPPPQPAQSALHTGRLDMLAFGDFGVGPPSSPPRSGASASSLPSQPPLPRPTAASGHSAVETGTLDLSAFGDFGTFGAHHMAPPEPSPQPPQPTPQLRQSSLETGTLDMSAFGAAFGGLASEPAVRTQPSAPEPPQTTAPEPQLSSTTPQPTHAALETGMLDMSAFGDFGGFGYSAPPPPPAPPPPAPPPPPPPGPGPGSPHDPMSSGMLDLSAFGGLDFVQTSRPDPEPEPVAQPQLGSTTSTTNLEAHASTSGGVVPDTRPPVLGLVGAPYTGAVTAPSLSAPTAAAAAAVPSQGASSAARLDDDVVGRTASAIRTAFAHPPFHESLRSAIPPPPPPLPLVPNHPASTADPTAPFTSFPQTPALGVSYGLGDPAAASWSQPAAGTAPLPHSHLSSQPTGTPVGPVPSNRTASSSLLFTPVATLPHQLSDLRPGHLEAGAAGAGPLVASGGSGTTAAAEKVEEDFWVAFPRVPEPATPADTSLPALLLTTVEVSELHRLLGQNPPALDADSGAGDCVQEVAAAAAVLGPDGMRRWREVDVDGDADVKGDAVADAVAALTALGLTPEDAAELCRLAGALSRRSVAPAAGKSDGGSSGAGAAESTTDGTTDVMVGLDFAARVFLVQARLAAERARAAAAAAAGVKDDGAFAAAVSQLFRPVSVSRSTAPPLSPTTASSSSAVNPTASTSGAAGPPRPSASATPSLARSIGEVGPGPTARRLGLEVAGSSGGPLGRAPKSFVGRSSAFATSYGQLSHASSPGGGRIPSGTASALVHRSRSTRSVLSVLSFSSLPESVAGGQPSRGGGAEVGEDGGRPGEANWWRLCGLLPGLDMRSVLAALCSGSQGQLLDALLPNVPWAAAIDDEASAAPEGRHAGMMGGGSAGAGAGGGVGPSVAPRPALSWPLMRKVGAGFWMADPRVLRERAEALAKAQYGRRKEPYDCALMYLALGRKALLVSLFRQSSNLKIADFLLRDFAQEEPRKSAAKNAFALLGQHRYELAAAFFILAGHHYEAVSVLVRERKDPQLALLVARLLDPPPPATGAAAAASAVASGMSGGPLARRLVEQELMPLAVASGDPCAVATLECLAGGPTRAVLQLIGCANGASSVSAVAAGGGGFASAAAPASSAATSGPASRLLPVDAAALDFCLRVGVQLLSGQSVRFSVCKALRKMAVQTSRALEHTGLVAAALEALRVAAAMLPRAAAAAAAASPLPALPPALLRRYSRLLAAGLSYSLTEAQVRQQQQPFDGGERAGDAVTAGAPVAVEGGEEGWQREAKQALTAMAPLLGTPVDEPAVLRLLSRHLSALRRVRQQLLVSPELLVSRALRPAAVTAAAAAATPTAWSSPPPAAAAGAAHPPPPLSRRSGHVGGVGAVAAGSSPVQQPASHPQVVSPSTSGTLERQISDAAATAAAAVPSAVRMPSGGGASGSGGRLSPESSSSSLAGAGAGAVSSPVAAGATVSPDGSGRGPTGERNSFSNSGRPPPGPSHASPGAPPPPHPLSPHAQVIQPPSLSGQYPQQPQLHPHQHLTHPAAAAALQGTPAAPSRGQTPPASPLSYSSASSAAGGTGGGGWPGSSSAVEGTARRTQEGASNSVPPTGWGAFDAPWDVLAVDGDRCRSVTVMKGRGPDDNGQLPFTVATAKSGLLGGVLGPPALAPPSKAAGPSSLFLGLMQSVLHHVRWTPDPWAMMSGDFADESFSGPPGSVPGSLSAATGAVGNPGGAPGGGAGSGGSVGGIRNASPILQTPGGGGGAVGSGAAGSTSAAVLVSHPERDIYLSGSNGQLVYQWRFGEALAQTAYVPCLEPHGSAAAAAAAAVVRSRSASGGGAPQTPAAAAVAVAASLDLHAAHWGHAAALSYSTPAGGRFAGIGEGGLVAMWRTDVLGPGGLGYADWTHQCVVKHGRAISFVGDSGSQLLVAGQGDRGGLVGWWDSLAPPSSACVAEIRGRKAVPTVLALLRPDAGGVLVFGDESGELAATDLRMMSSREYIWTIPKTHGSVVTAISQWGPAAAGVLNLPAVSPAAFPGAGGPAQQRHAGPAAQHGQHAALLQVRMSNLFVSGGKDGSLALVDISSGKVVSYLERAHCSLRTGLPGLLAAAAGGGGAKSVDRTIVRRSRPAASSGVAVGGLSCMRDAGVLSCGADGVVRYHPLAPQMLDLRR